MSPTAFRDKAIKYAETAVFIFICLNVLVFFILGMFFDGGAFPFGRIESGRFLIDNNDGVREVSESWFRFTFWHGVLVWGGGPALVVSYLAVKDVAHAIQHKEASAILKPIAFLTLLAGWVFFVFVLAEGITT